MDHEEKMDKYLIGTKVIILKDCRRWKRATGKKGVIYKNISCIILADTFPLDLHNTVIHITNECEDLKFEMPVIKYGRLGKIRGDQCWWTSIENY